jgi:hypothetical protein
MANRFPWQKIQQAITKELLKTVFSVVRVVAVITQQRSIHVSAAKN